MTQKILVVDDDGSNRVTIERILNREGYEVSHADSGRTALDFLREERVDLVITDLKMPGMTGIDVLKAIGQMDPDIEVIVMTAFGTVETAVEAMKEGAYDFVQALKRLELVTCVRKSLERRALQMKTVNYENNLGPWAKVKSLASPM